MVAIKEIRASNSALSVSPTALFVGATSGIGLATIRHLLIQTPSPTIYIVGRSQARFQSELSSLQALNKTAKITFIEAQVSLLNDVAKACKVVSSNESKLDILWLSCGYLSLDAREETSEGLTAHVAVGYYARQLFTNLMLPLLQKAPSPRVLTILAAGQEGAINTSDLGLVKAENYNLLKSSNQSAAMMSLAFEHLSKENPGISFIHQYPGFVDTSVAKKMFEGLSGWLAPVGWLVRWILLPFATLFSTSVEEAGERGLYLATSSTYDVNNKGFWRLDGSDEECGPNKTLDEYRDTVFSR